MDLVVIVHPRQEAAGMGEPRGAGGRARRLDMSALTPGGDFIQPHALSTRRRDNAAIGAVGQARRHPPERGDSLNPNSFVPGRSVPNSELAAVATGKLAAVGAERAC